MTALAWTSSRLRTPRFMEAQVPWSGPSNPGYKRVRRYFEPSEYVLRVKEEELRQAEKDEAHTEQRLEELEVVWNRRRRSVLEEIERTRQGRHDVMKSLEELKRVLLELGAMHGGPTAGFVESNLFLLASGGLTLLNLVCLGLALRQNVESQFILFQIFFVAWYTVELLLKLYSHHTALWAGTPGSVASNWLDVFIVVSGIASICVPVALVCREMFWVLLLRLMSFWRFPLVKEMIRLTRDVDMSFMDKAWFGSIIMYAIIANSVVLGLETDMPWSGWDYLDEVFLLIFFTELMLNLKRWGVIGFLCDPDDWMWNCLDVLIVFGGVMDQWAIPVISAVMVLQDAELKKRIDLAIQLLRLMRLMRIVRIMRLTKHVRPLHNLIVGIVEAVQSMGWVVMLTLLMIYALSLLIVRLVGHGLIFGGKPPEYAADVFPTVPDTMFVLFQVMNGRQKVLEPLFVELPATKLAFVMFMVTSNWALLAILTGVVSETMLKATERNEYFLKTSESMETTEMSCERLREIFQDFDADGSKIISENAFRNLLKDEHRSAEMCEITFLKNRDLEDLFQVLSEEDENGKCVHFEDFIDKLLMENCPARERSVFRLEKEVRRLEKRIRSDLREIRNALRDGRVPVTSSMPSARQSLYGTTVNRTSMVAGRQKLSTSKKEPITVT